MVRERIQWKEWGKKARKNEEGNKEWPESQWEDYWRMDQKFSFSLFLLSPFDSPLSNRIEWNERKLSLLFSDIQSENVPLTFIFIQKMSLWLHTSKFPLLIPSNDSLQPLTRMQKRVLKIQRMRKSDWVWLNTNEMNVKMKVNKNHEVSLNNVSEWKCEKMSEKTFFRKWDSMKEKEEERERKKKWMRRENEDSNSRQ